MDRFVELAAEEMGVDLREPVIFVHGIDEDESPCDDEQHYGCAFGEGVYARGVPQEHELVHGVRQQHGGSVRFFEEGTAMAFGDDMHGWPPVHGDLVDGMIAGSDRNLPADWYPRAGHFAAWLHEHYGPEVTTALLLETDRHSTAGMAVTVLEQTIGSTFEEIRQDYANEPTCSPSQYRYPLVPCEQPVMLRARCNETVELEQLIRIACDEPSTLGPRDDGIWRYLVMEVESDGLYEVLAFEPADPFSALEIKECALGCDSILHDQLHGVDIFGIPVRLHAGRYVIKLPVPSDDPVDMQVTVDGLACL